MALKTLFTLHSAISAFIHFLREQSSLVPGYNTIFTVLHFLTSCLSQTQIWPLEYSYWTWLLDAFIWEADTKWTTAQWFCKVVEYIFTLAVPEKFSWLSVCMWPYNHGLTLDFSDTKVIRPAGPGRFSWKTGIFGNLLGWDFNTAFTGKETAFTIIADGTREPYVMLSTVVCIPKIF